MAHYYVDSICYFKTCCVAKCDFFFGGREIVTLYFFLNFLNFINSNTQFWDGKDSFLTLINIETHTHNLTKNK